MLVEEVDAARVDALGNVLADLVRASAVDHVESGPSVLSLGTGRGANEERVLELALEVVLLDIVGHGDRDLPIVMGTTRSAHDPTVSGQCSGNVRPWQTIAGREPYSSRDKMRQLQKRTRRTLRFQQ